MGCKSLGAIGGLLGGVSGFFVGGPMGAAVGAGIGGSIGTGISGADAATDAANMQAASANHATQVQWDMFQQQQQNQQPWLKAGTAAVNQLSAGTQQGGQFATTPHFKFDPDSVNVLKDPGYKFRLQSGADALAAGGSAMGNLGSGNLGVALTKYGQDLGSQEYGAAYGREYSSALDQYNASMNEQNTMFNRLSGIAGTGQTTANNLMTAGMNTAGQIGQNAIGAGNALAAGRVGSANAMAGGIQGTTNQLMGGAQAYNFNQNYQNYLSQQQMNNGLQGTGYGSDSLNFSGNEVGSGMVDNYGASIYG